MVSVYETYATGWIAQKRPYVKERGTLWYAQQYQQ